MIDLNLLTEFSRNHCAAICALLVPANLLATLQTIIGVSCQRSRSQIQIMACAASLWALTMVLHVGTWLMIGVVMMPTFILLGLGCTCLVINGWAIWNPQNMAGSIRWVLNQRRSLVFQGLQNWGAQSFRGFPGNKIPL